MVSTLKGTIEKSDKRRSKAKGEMTKHGYRSLSLTGITVDNLLELYDKFQEDSGKPLLNYPTLSQFLQTVLTAYSSQEVPRLILVCKSDTRTVIYDSTIRLPVVVDIDKNGSLACTRMQGASEYMAFARKENPGMFARAYRK